MACYNPQITGLYNPVDNLNKQRFFIGHVDY